MLSIPLLVAVAVSQATAATIRVDVGKGLTFTPNSITAAVGDNLEFHFLGGEHDVARGDFSKPCEPAASGGFYSGVFRPKGGEASDVFRVTVTDTDPIFFYCSVEFHCSGGMVGVVNPSSGQTLEAYTSAAGSAYEVSPPAPFGGQLGPAGSFSDSGSGSGSGSSSSPASASGSGSNSSTGATAGESTDITTEMPTNVAAPSPTGLARSSLTVSATRSHTGSSTGSTRPTKSSPVSVSGGSSASGASGIPQAAFVGIIGMAALALF